MDTPQKRPAPTLAHVARQAGVSKATASAALRGADGPAAETALHVRRVARQLGYRSKVGARALRTGLGSTVAVVLDPPKMSRRLLVDTYWAKFVNSLVMTCSAQGVPVMLVAAEDASTLAGHALDAVLFMSDDSTIADFEALGFGLPLIKLEIGPNSGPRVTTILRLDLARCIREVMDHLHSAGARRPGLVIGREREYVAPAEQAYRTWCERNGVLPAVVENEDPHDDKLCIREAQEMIDDGVDGFFTFMSDPTNIVKAGIQTGRRVPTEVALVAQTDWVSIPFWDVPLSNVSFLGSEAGAIAGQALLDVTSGIGPAEVALPYCFIPRASSRAPQH